MKFVLHILAQRIIVGTDGEIRDHGLNSTFVCFRCFVQGLFTSGNGEGGSEQISVGASISQKPPTDNVERFLSMLKFDSREKMNALGRYVDPEASKTDISRFESGF